MLSGGVWQAYYIQDSLLKHMAVNASGTILYTESYAAYIVPPGTNDLAKFMQYNVGGIMAAALDPAGVAYIETWNGGAPSISKLSSGAFTIYAGGGAVCASATDAWGDGCPATSAVLSTGGGHMTSDPYGNIYFTDYYNNVVRRVDHQTGIITRVAGAGGYGYGGDGGLATAANTGNIVGLTVDAFGDIFISHDPFGAKVIRKVDGATGIITTMVVSGVTTPGALALDSQGKLYVADYATARITGVSNVSGTSTNCQAPTPVAGVCGPANGRTLVSAPTLASDLCSAGTPYPAAGSGPWTWSCAGLNQGSTASCSAQAFVRQPQSISFPNPGPATYGDYVWLSATATSGLDVSYSVTSGPAQIYSGSGLIITGTGPVTVQASQAGDTNWLPATPVSVTFTTNSLLLTVIAGNAGIYQGSALPSPLTTVSFNGFVNGDTAAVVHGAAVLSTTATSSSAPGNYPIVISRGTLSAANYTFQFVNGVLSVLAPPRVQLSLSAALAVQSSAYQITLTITNGGNADAAGVTLTTATLGTATGSPLPQTVGTVKAGSSGKITFTFPLSAGSGETVAARFAGTYTGGTFSSNIRVVLP